MKFLVLYFLAVATVSSSPIADDYASSLPTAVVDYDAPLLPIVESGLSNSVDNLVDNTPLVQPTIIINGNVAIEIHDNMQTCCNQQNDTVTPTPPKLPDGYVITFEDDNYITAIKFHPIAQNWNEARKTCFQEGGFLAYASNKEEEDLYLKMMDHNKLNDLWNGIHDYFQESDFSTVLGEVAKEVAYYTWLPGEPNNAGGPEPCTHYWRIDGNKLGLNDQVCTHSHPFNCKIKLRKN